MKKNDNRRSDAIFPEMKHIHLLITQNVLKFNIKISYSLRIKMFQLCGISKNTHLLWTLWSEPRLACKWMEFIFRKADTKN